MIALAHTHDPFVCHRTNRNESELLGQIHVGRTYKDGVRIFMLTQRLNRKRLRFS